jgi:Holliday junction DNA helicase RuvA
MIRTIAGIVTQEDVRGLVVETAGIGYLVSVTKRTKGQLGEQIRLFTYHHIKEDGQALFGFESMGELQLFEQLISVSSIGPKLAMSILSVAKPEDIITAVSTDNVGFFQAISGIGKKSALKIIIELKGKLTGESSSGLPSGGLLLADALTSLGYATTEIQQVIQRVPTGLSDEEQVAWALRELATR